MTRPDEVVKDQPVDVLAAALAKWWYAERSLVAFGGDNLRDVLANDARIILSALTDSGYRLIAEADLERTATALGDALGAIGFLRSVVASGERLSEADDIRLDALR